MITAITAALPQVSRCEDSPVVAETAECMQSPLPVTFARLWDPRSAGVPKPVAVTLSQNGLNNKNIESH
jgi:hypothetical protein